MYYLFIKNLKKKVNISSLKEVRIGSGEGSNLKFKTDKLKDIHCILVRNGSSYILRANDKVLVNNQEVVEKVLSNNDELKMGPLQIIFLTGGGASSVKGLAQTQRFKKGSNPTVAIPREKAGATRATRPEGAKSSKSRGSIRQLRNIRKEVGKKRLNPIYPILGVALLLVAGLLFMLFKPSSEAIVGEFKSKWERLEKEKRDSAKKGRFQEALSKLEEMRLLYSEVSEGVREKHLKGYVFLLKSDEEQIKGQMSNDKERDDLYSSFSKQYEEWNAMPPQIKEVETVNSSSGIVQLRSKYRFTEEVMESRAYLSLQSGVPEYKDWKGDFDLAAVKLKEFKRAGKEKLQQINPGTVFDTAKSFIDEKNWSQAKEVLDKFIKISPDSENVNKATGMIGNLIIPSANDEWRILKRKIKKIDDPKERKEELERHQKRFEGVIELTLE